MAWAAGQDESAISLLDVEASVALKNHQCLGLCLASLTHTYTTSAFGHGKTPPWLTAWPEMNIPDHAFCDAPTIQSGMDLDV